MVTGEECYRAMSELEQRRWMRNNIKHSSALFLLGLRYHNFCDFIESSFDWSITKEGTEYWATVCEKYKLHDQLNPGQYFKTKPPNTF
jgi:hypothetical protein